MILNEMGFEFLGTMFMGYFRKSRPCKAHERKRANFSKFRTNIRMKLLKRQVYLKVIECENAQKN